MSDKTLSDLQKQALRLFMSTARLVSMPVRGDVEELRRQTNSARDRLGETVRCGGMDALVAVSAMVLMDRLHEAALEFDLSRTLGLQDPRGADAAHRATTAVSIEGRALFRALDFLVEDIRLGRRSGSVN